MKKHIDGMKILFDLRMISIPMAFSSLQFLFLTLKSHWNPHWDCMEIPGKTSIYLLRIHKIPLNPIKSLLDLMEIPWESHNPSDFRGQQKRLRPPPSLSALIAPTRWEDDPRCANPLDGKPGCEAPRSECPECHGSSWLNGWCLIINKH